MTKRFLVIGDNHLDSHSPSLSLRLDSYMETCLMELLECLQIARAMKVDFCVFLGDIFNRIEVGGACRNRAIEVLSKDEDGNPWPFKKYVVIGNHDVANNLHYLNKSALQTLLSSNVIELVDQIEDLPVYLLHYDTELDETIRSGALMHYEDAKIFFAHSSVTDKPALFSHVLFKDIYFPPSAKIFFSGHIHHPMEDINEDGVRFFNPGSIGRTDSTQTHSPQVLLVQYDFETDKCSHKYFKLKNSLPHDIIFDIDRKKKIKDTNLHTEKFIEAMNDIEIDDLISADIEKDFISFANKKEVKENVIKIVVDSINTIKTGGKIHDD